MYSSEDQEQSNEDEKNDDKMDHANDDEAVINN